MMVAIAIIWAITLLIAYHYGKQNGYIQAELDRMKDELEFRWANIKVGDKVRLSADGSGRIVSVTETNIRLLADMIGRGEITKEESQ